MRQHIDSTRSHNPCLARHGAIWRDMPTNQGKDSRFAVFGTARYEAIWAQAIPEVREVPQPVMDRFS
jgi:hypothetical protein